MTSNSVSADFPHALDSGYELVQRYLNAVYLLIKAISIIIY